MEKVDSTDSHTPTGGGMMDLLPPYVAYGHNGHLMNLSYTEKARCSSPFAPTQIPPKKRSNSIVGLQVAFSS